MCFPSGSAVKNPPTMPETWVRSLGREDPLEEEMATHSSLLAWRIPWAEEAIGLQSVGAYSPRGRAEQLSTHTELLLYGEGEA